MKKTAVIFGGTGQDGHYLKKLMERQGILVECPPHWEGDVGRRFLIEHYIALRQPDYVFHLAAVSSDLHEFLFDNQKSIVDGTVHVLESCLKNAPNAKIFITGSILQFNGTPVAVNSPLSYDSPYAVQRHASVAITRYYRKQGLKIYVGYFGHHESPRRHPSHLSQRIAQTVRRIFSGTGERLELFYPNDRKEWNFAGDIMEAVWTLMHNTSGIDEAVLGGGEAYSIWQFAHECFASVGLTLEDHVINHGFRDVPRLSVTDSSPIRSLGWSPKVSMPELAAMMVAP